jgi:hypothetical protein
VGGRLDEDKVEQLRYWATGLSDDGSPELRATAKAILLLIEEIDRLYVDLWNAKAMLGHDEHGSAGEAESEATPDRAFAARLRRFGSRMPARHRDS